MSVVVSMGCIHTGGFNESRLDTYNQERRGTRQEKKNEQEGEIQEDEKKRNGRKRKGKNREYYKPLVFSPVLGLLQSPIAQVRLQLWLHPKLNNIPMGMIQSERDGRNTRSASDLIHPRLVLLGR